MDDAADESIEKSRAGKDEKLVLEYSSIIPGEDHSNTFSSVRIIWPFALGAVLPFMVISLKEQGTEAITIGLFVTWGLSALLLVAIKLRGVFVQQRPNGRPWWACLIGGIVNMAAFYFLLQETTARERFWPILGAGGSFVVAIILAAVIALAIATALTPGEHKVSALGQHENGDR